MKRIGIVGARGLVGQELLSLFQENARLKNEFECMLFSRQKEASYWGLDEDLDRLHSCSVVFNAAHSDFSHFWLKQKPREQVFIDNSSALRMLPEIPLCVPEINSDQIQEQQRVIANPNCTSILLALALLPLRGFLGERLFVSTYQAASGAGLEGLNELKLQLKSKAKKDYPVFGYPLHNNVISHNSSVLGPDSSFWGSNEEEKKVMEEIPKILEYPELEIHAHCFRVPVERAHTETVTVELKEEIELERLLMLYKDQAGLELVQDAEKNLYPMPLMAEGKKDVFVGRFRFHPQNSRLLSFVLCGDQLLKGAAWNAFQIFKEFHRKSLLH